MSVSGFRTMGELDFSPMDVGSAREIIKWRYPSPYEIYNPTPMQEQNWFRTFINERSDYHRITDARSGEMTAYCCFGYEAQVPGGDYSFDALDTGFAMKPELTGIGLGAGYAEAVIRFGRSRYGPTHIRVTVASFNKRALRMWDKLDFFKVEIFTSTHNGIDFVVLLKKVAA